MLYQDTISNMYYAIHLQQCTLPKKTRYAENSQNISLGANKRLTTFKIALGRQFIFIAVESVASPKYLRVGSGGHIVIIFACDINIKLPTQNEINFTPTKMNSNESVGWRNVCYFDGFQFFLVRNACVSQNSPHLLIISTCATPATSQHRLNIYCGSVTRIPPLTSWNASTSKGAACSYNGNRTLADLKSLKYTRDNMNA